MVAGGHRIIAEDALKLVESLSLSTPTHGHTLVTILLQTTVQPVQLLIETGTIIEQLNRWGR